MSRKKVDISKLDLEKIGGRVAYVRLKSGLSMNDFGNIVGLSKGNISRLENHSYDPSYKSIVEICKNFKVNPSWLLLNIGEPDDETHIEIEPVTTPSNETEFEHMALVKTFKNKELAKELNIILKEIEDLDSDHLREVKGILRSELSMLRLTSQSYTGEDRRKVQRRKADNGVIPGGTERRSGEDRRKASGGDH